MNAVIPFLKWAGGKRWFVNQHKAWLRTDANRYFEPFLGSGAVFFHLVPKDAVLADLNKELISTYQSLRDEPEELWRNLCFHQEKHSREYYYHVRSLEFLSPLQRAARFIYLNRTCFNGLYRVNLKGVFNVPIGTKTKVVLPSDDFSGISSILKQANIIDTDFRETIAMAREGDFIYVDPPYTVRHNNNNFIKYNERIFSWTDQKALSESLSHAVQRGAYVLMSNADHSCIRKLYSSSAWQCLTVERFSTLASSAKHRKGTTELVVSNYLNRNGEQVDARV